MYLNCHSYHSLRYGTIPLEELVAEAKRCAVKTLALTDINTVTGIYDFEKACKDAGIKPVVGMEVRKEDQLLYIALAQNAQGIKEICTLLTEHNCEGTPLLPIAPEFKHLFTVYPLENCPPTLRNREYLGIRLDEIHSLIRPELRAYLDRMVVLAPVTFRDENEYQLHRILRAIDKNVVLSKLDHFCKSHEYMRPEQELKELYKQYPQIIQNTQHILDQCSFSFDFKTPKNKKHFTSSLEEDRLLLEKLAYEGLEKRYGTENAEAIHALRFNSYFLITWDIVRFSNSQGFLHIGRGSGANSIVSYCLGITNICPIELDLYFERFLNLNRKSPPDFDIDWSWKERDIILDYIFKKYGKHHVAFCGTNVEFKYRSILREVGKVFGLPKEELDVLTNSPQSTHDQNQRSMHACGILISEEPLTTYSALEMPPKGFPIVQFDMHVAEEIGLEKFDILSQRGIGHINDSVKLIRENQGIEVDIRNPALSKDEAQANVYLSQGKTIGCFYIESPAMRGLLRRLKCDNYRTLVAASSIIRPGVAQSGMMREYIFRHNNPGQFEYFHPVFEEHLGETYGIMVYQEDVIRVALYYGGIAEADGDILRRAMSGKGRSLSALQRVKDNFLASCAKQGHPEDLSREVYRQIESFAGYSFCKAHSASYAVESYQSLYLKVYYPLEFMVAVINNQGGFYRTEVYIHEARMSGGNILNPCVNKSKVETSIYGKDIYLGFMHLQSLEARIMNEIVVERDRNGEYLDLEDFIKRVPVGLEALEILIFIGAFRFTGKSKNELLVQARLLLTKAIIRAPELIQAPSKEYTLPKLERSPFEDAFDEIELLGFPVSCSPFDLLKTKYRGNVLVKDLVHHHKKEVKMLAYLISRKHVPTKLGTMYFGTWIDVEGQYFDTAHFPNSLKQYPFQGGGCYLLKGIVEVDYHFPTVTITRMARLPFIPDPRYIHDKDREYKVHEQIREDISLTQRAPYPQAHEIGLPRWKVI
jgi:error-prone DNA polymerase